MAEVESFAHLCTSVSIVSQAVENFGMSLSDTRNVSE